MKTLGLMNRPLFLHFIEHLLWRFTHTNYNKGKTAKCKISVKNGQIQNRLTHS